MPVVVSKTAVREKGVLAPRAVPPIVVVGPNSPEKLNVKLEALALLETTMRTLDIVATRQTHFIEWSLLFCEYLPTPSHKPSMSYPSPHVIFECHDCKPLVLEPRASS